MIQMMSKTYPSEELLYSTIIDLVKVAEILLDKNKEKGVRYTPEEFEKTVRNVAKAYSLRAWRDEKHPLYCYTLEGEPIGLEHDLEVLMTHYIDLSKNELTESGKLFLEHYGEKLNVFSAYKIRTMKRTIDDILN